MSASAAVPDVEMFGDEEVNNATAAAAGANQHPKRLKDQDPRPAGIVPLPVKKVEKKQAAKVDLKAKRFLVTMRHSPALRKSLIIQAPNPKAAWAEFQRINIEAAKNSRASAKNMAAWNAAMTAMDSKDGEPQYSVKITEVTGKADVNPRGNPPQTPEGGK